MSASMSNEESEKPSAMSSTLTSSFLTTSNLKVTTILHLADFCLLQSPTKFSSVETIRQLSTKVSNVKAGIQQLLFENFDNCGDNCEPGLATETSKLSSSPELYQSCIQMIKKLTLFQVRCEEEALKRMGGRPNNDPVYFGGDKLPVEIQTKSVSSTSTLKRRMADSAENRPDFKFWQYVAECFDQMTSLDPAETDADKMERLYQSFDPCTRMIINQFAAKQFDKVVKIVKQNNRNLKSVEAKSNGLLQPVSTVNFSKFDQESQPLEPVTLMAPSHQLEHPPYLSSKPDLEIKSETETCSKKLFCSLCHTIDDHRPVDCRLDSKVKFSRCFTANICVRCLEPNVSGHRCSISCDRCLPGKNLHHPTLCFATGSGTSSRVVEQQPVVARNPRPLNNRKNFECQQVLRYNRCDEDDTKDDDDDILNRNVDEPGLIISINSNQDRKIGTPPSTTTTTASAARDIVQLIDFETELEPHDSFCQSQPVSNFADIPDPYDSDSEARFYPFINGDLIN